MRKYQPIWLRLKLERQAQVAAPLAMHARILKAVIKEKYGDNTWKKVLRERGEKSILTHKIEDTLITFNLTIIRQMRLRDII